MSKRTAGIRFCDLYVGDVFDFVNDASLHNSFFNKCMKTGKREYTSIEPNKHSEVYRIGSVNAKVYHLRRLSAA